MKYTKTELDLATGLLAFAGEDPSREGLHETPKRFLKALEDWTAGYTQRAGDILKTFEDGAQSTTQMVIVRKIRLYSLCEHHMATFFGFAHIGYIPDGRIVGLSKLKRLVDIYARRLQVQERLTNQIADALAEHLKPRGVAVVVNCRHMCMESRGINSPGQTTVTSARRGAAHSMPTTCTGTSSCRNSI
jgi:GTP cyclohydrolase I